MTHNNKLAKKQFKKFVIFLMIFIGFGIAYFNPKPIFAQAQCCPSSHPNMSPHASCPFGTPGGYFCCYNDTAVLAVDCASLVSPQPTGLPQPTPGQMNPTDPLTVDKLKSMNPLLVFQGNQALINASGSLSVSGIINRALSFIFPLAGLLLFLMLVWGGFEMLTGAASKKNMDAGKERIMAAIIGFLLLFASYWIVQIVEYITGVQILG